MSSSRIDISAGALNQVPNVRPVWPGFTHDVGLACFFRFRFGFLTGFSSLSRSRIPLVSASMVSMGLLTCGIVSLSFWYFRDCAKDAEESGCLFQGLLLRFAGRGLESYDRERRKSLGMFP